MEAYDQDNFLAWFWGVDVTYFDLGTGLFTTQWPSYYANILKDSEGEGGIDPTEFIPAFFQ